MGVDFWISCNRNTLFQHLTSHAPRRFRASLDMAMAAGQVALSGDIKLRYFDIFSQKGGYTTFPKVAFP